MLNQHGKMSLGTILLTLAVSVGIYVVIRLAPVYVRDFQINNLVETAARQAADPRRKARVLIDLSHNIVENNVPISFEDFVIEEFDDNVMVSVDWETQVEFIPENSIVPPVIRSFSFHYEAVEPIKR